LRDDEPKFTAAGASIVAIAPESIDAVQRYLQKNPTAYPILSDNEHTAFDAYDVVSRAMSLGQRPAVFVIDKNGVVQFDSVGTQQWQIPSNEKVLSEVAGIAKGMSS
jgi:peroxiredoxin